MRFVADQDSQRGRKKGMGNQNSLIVNKPDLALDTYGTYEIRVKGLLDVDRWAQWFDGMTVTVQDGETIISGPIPDQAALYGMLSRLRDLALPLVSLEKIDDGRVLPPRDSRTSREFPGKINWPLVLLYLLFAAGSSALTVFFTSEHILHTALALALLFAAMGGIAAVFLRVDRAWGWGLLTRLNGLAAGITMMITLMVTGWLPVALGIALMLFAVASWIAYQLYHRPGTRIARPAAPKDTSR
jgi:hypothetical protein